MDGLANLIMYPELPPHTKKAARWRRLHGGSGHGSTDEDFFGLQTVGCDHINNIVTLR